MYAWSMRVSLGLQKPVHGFRLLGITCTAGEESFDKPRARRCTKKIRARISGPEKHVIRVRKKKA